MNSKDVSTYSVIPSLILDDKNLSAKDILLYARISSLCNKYGFCFASNSYFAEKTGDSIRTIQRGIQKLIQNGYITSECIYKPESKEVEQRQIKLKGLSFHDLSGGQVTGVMTPHVTDVMDNNINGNNISLIGKIPPDREEAKKYYEEKGYTFGFDYWYDSNDSKGWYVGKSKMKNWKANMSVWNQNRKKTNKSNDNKEESSRYKTYEQLIEEQRRGLENIRKLTGG